MTAKPYAVLDSGGVKLNTVMLSDMEADNYNPGYGDFLVEEALPPGTEVDPLPPLPVLDIKIKKHVPVGKKVNIKDAKPKPPKEP